MKHKDIRREFREAIKEWNSGLPVCQQIQFETLPASPFKATLPDGIMINKGTNQAVWVEFKYQYDKMSSKQKHFMKNSAAFAVVHLREYKEYYRIWIDLYIYGEAVHFRYEDDGYKVVYEEVRKRNKKARINVYKQYIAAIFNTVEFFVNEGSL
jgi:hypothetical protein